MNASYDGAQSALARRRHVPRPVSRPAQRPTQYEVDFGRTIVNCTAVATIGPAGDTAAAGEINLADRTGNAEAVFVDTNDSAGAPADRPFRLVVVC